MPAITIRKATLEDLPRVIELIYLGAAAGPLPVPPAPLPAGFVRALERFEANPDAAVMVAELDGTVVGTFSLTFLANLSNGGRDVAQIESVHVARRSVAITSAKRCFVGRSRRQKRVAVSAYS